MSETYQAFVRNATTRVPGFLTRMFEEYTGSQSNPINFIGRQESLGEDLTRYLHSLGEAFSAQAIVDTSRVNVGHNLPSTSFSTNLLICLSEFGVYERYGYYSDVLDLIRFRHLQHTFPHHALQLQRLALATDKLHWPNDNERSVAGVDTDDGRRCARILTNFGLYCEHVIGDKHEAGECYRNAVFECPKHARSLGRLGQHLAENGAAIEAAELLRRSLRLRPNQPVLVETLSHLVKASESNNRWKREA